MKIISIISILFSFIGLDAADLPFFDNYTKAELDHRRPTRGPWVFEEGVMSCTQDDALYGKYKQHGPVTWYDLEFNDATIRFSYWADFAVQNFIFTINGGKKHVFRFIQGMENSRIKTFPREGEKKGPLATDTPNLIVGKWVDVEVTLKGSHSIVKIGDYIHKAHHPAIDRPKTTIGLGFSFGSMKFRNFSVR